MRAMSLMSTAVGLAVAVAVGIGPGAGGAPDDVVVGHLAAAPVMSAERPAAAEGQAILPRAVTATSVAEQRARRSDGEVDRDARALRSAMTSDRAPDAATELVITSPEGFQVVRGTAEAGSGPLVTYTVEVEPSVGVDPLSVAALIEEALHDPRSWANEATLQRIEEPDTATIRVVLAEPATVDELCRQAGLDTSGRFSCWNGRFAALNAMRWETGAADFDDLTTYRRYLINHEFGHGLGYDHRDCGAPGEPAPVMMQQTKGTGDCEPNGWPYPELPPP